MSLIELRDWVDRLGVVDRGVDDATRIDQLRALEEIKSAAAAAQARIASDLDESVRAAEAAAGVSVRRQGRGVAAQIALARRDSPHAGGRHLGLARALREMPHTAAALAAGVISEWRATVLVRETACLSVDHRAAVDREVAGDRERLAQLGDGGLARSARAAAARLDAAAMAARARKAETERCVTLRPAPDTMTYLTALLPVADGVAAYAALTAAARQARVSGDPRGRGQVMADALVARVTGRDQTAPVPVQVGLVMTDRALLAGDPEPALVEGYGPIPAPLARRLVIPRTGPPRAGAPRAGDSRAGAPLSLGQPRPVDQPGPVDEFGPVGQSRPDDERVPGEGSRRAADSGAIDDSAEGSRVWLRRLFTHPLSGELVAMDARARIFPPGLRRFLVARDQTCRTPWCDAPIRHVDHVVASAAGGPTEAANGQGLCEACNYAKETPGWAARVLPEDGSGEHVVELSTPTGHCYRSKAPPLPGGRSSGDAHPRAAPMPGRVPPERSRPATSGPDLVRVEEPVAVGDDAQAYPSDDPAASAEQADWAVRRFRLVSRSTAA